MTAATCIDASVIAKLVLAESDSAQAASLVLQSGRNGAIVVPLHLYAETTSAVYKRVRQGSLETAEAISAVEHIESLSLTRAHPPGIAQRALAIAAQLNLRYPYDAFYLALGELLDCDVWTADRAFYTAAHESFSRVRLLADFADED